MLALAEPVLQHRMALTFGARAEGMSVRDVIAGLVMLGVLVIVHEFGHFALAKLFKVGVPVFSVGMGLILPSAMAGGMIPFPQMAGTASALLGFAQQGAAAVATAVAAARPQDSAVSVGLCVAALGGAAALTWVVLLRPRRGLAGEVARD